MPFLGHWYVLVIILAIVLIVYGPGKLPEVGGAIGKAMREFRKATSELTNEVTTAAQAKPEPPSPTASTGSESAPKSSTSEASPPPS